MLPPPFPPPRHVPRARPQFWALGIVTVVAVAGARLLLIDPQQRGDVARAQDGKPIGRGIVAAHVEGQPGDYMPDRQDPRFDTVRFHDAAGPSKANGHATSTARVIYGRAGEAPGIRDVYCMTADHFLQGGCLRTGTDLPPHAPHDMRVFNHSWIGGEPPLGRQILRRVDLLIDREDVVMCVGVNNGKTSTVPFMLASAYNVIAVGAASGNSSGGYTRYAGEGRCKPDLTAMRQLTSFSTPEVTAAAAKLLEAAASMADDTPRARRAQTIKALLMAGASKPETWAPAPGKPLDEFLGAGVLDFDKSLAMLVAGLNPPPLMRNLLGWDFRTLDRQHQVESYRLTLERPMGELSVMLVWHRRVDGRTITDPITRTRMWIDRPTLANLDLRLQRLDSRGNATLVAESASTIDNVEHVFLRVLPAGTYRIDVTRSDAMPAAWEYALAWRVDPPPPPPPPPAPDVAPQVTPPPQAPD